MTLKIFNRIGFTLFVLKSALAAGFSWYIASLVSHNAYPYFAALGAVLTVQATVVDSLRKAWQRIVGVIGGVIVSIIVGHWLPLDPVSIATVVLIGMAFGTALRLSSPTISQIAISSLLVLAFGHQQGYAFDRITETMVGCVIAILVNTVVIPPNPIPDAERRVLFLSEYASTVLGNLAFAFEENALSPVDMPYIQDLVDETEKSYQAVYLATLSLRYSPILRNKRSRVTALSAIILRFERITIQIRGIARALVDLGTRPQPNPHLIETMRSTATCIALAAKREISSASEDQITVHQDVNQLLNQAVHEARNHHAESLSCIRQTESAEELMHVGSILTDLNRILDEVTGEGRAVTKRGIHIQ